MASTWNGTAGNQLVTIAAWNDFYGGMTGTSTKIITKAMICAVVGSAGYCTNNPIAGMTSNQCPTKDEILATQ